MPTNLVPFRFPSKRTFSRFRVRAGRIRGAASKMMRPEDEPAFKRESKILFDLYELDLEKVLSEGNRSGARYKD